MALASGSSIDQKELVNLIQCTIQESVHNSLLPMQSTVQALTDKSIIQDKRLDRVERTLETQQEFLQEMDSQHARRMDAFQDELVQLQKTISSPRAAQSPSSLGGSPVSAAGLSPGTFDLVIGGWKEGCTKDWVEKELAN